MSESSREVPRAPAGEFGYSLIEVLAAIVVLTVALVPMVGMFDAALQAVGVSGGYDAARACAGQKLEQARSLPYEIVSAGLPDGACEPSGLGYEVSEEFVDAELGDTAADHGLIRVTVRVSWDDNVYEAAGIVSRW